MSESRLLRQERNCWRVERATRVAWLVDGAAYFAAFRNAVARARRSVFVLAWDVNSRLRLVREEQPADGLPAELAEFLGAVVSRNPELEVHLLPWDYHPIYALEREWLPGLRFPDAIRFRLDNSHPLGGSQHQKVVVVDDRVAFVGGLDLSVMRWDTRDHAAEDPRRRDPAGDAYPPFHDVQMLVEGPVAAALGEMARERWRRAGGAEPRAAIRNPERRSSPWPAGVTAALEDVPVAIARTVPAYEDRPARREIEQLYLDVIGRARRFLYIENQYLSCRRLGRALEERLEQADGPEVVLVLPRRTGGWLEQHTMDLLRVGLLERMREADRHGRLRVFHPVINGNAGQQEIVVHGKLLIADDRFLRVGSANLSNRSMGLDSECDLALEAAGDESITRAIRRLRIGLLAEHLGLNVTEAEASLGDPDSLIAAIEEHRGGARTLEPLQAEFDSQLERRIAQSTWLDPERPADPEQWISRHLPAKQRTTARRRIALWAGLVGVLVTLAVAWRWGPLGELLDRDALASAFAAIEHHPLAPAAVVPLVALLGCVGVPINLLMVAAALTFGPWLGFAYALAGAQLSAMASFAAGHYAGVRFLRRLAGSKLNDLSKRLADRGLLAMFVVRLVPVAPFAVINLVAGASHISWRNFALGTLFGIAPGLLAVALLTDRLRAAVQAPDPTTWLALLLVAAAILGSVLLVRRWLRRRSSGD